MDGTQARWVRTAREVGAKVHAANVCSKFTFVKSRGPLHLQANIDTQGMEDRWPQRAEFRSQLLAWRKRERLTLKSASERLGVKYGTIRQYISPSRVDTKPSFELLKRAAALFGVSVWLFDDNPDVISDSESQLSAIDKFMANVVGNDLSRLTDHQKTAAFEAWRAIVRGYESKS